MIEQQPSRQTLDEVPKRVFTFVIGVVEVPAVATILGAKGYNDAEHAYAWSRLTRLAVVGPRIAPEVYDRKVRDAIVELDAWDEPNFAVIKAALQRLHPDQAAFVFEGLEPKQGPESVVGISTLLDRLDALQDAPDRVSTRPADHAALATLATRGYTSEERARVRALVNLTKTVVVAPPISNEERSTITLELYAWFNDWATTARSVITRRDHLIRLGLAKRRKSNPKDQAGGGAPGGGA